jgi:tetratricopeptide (TPR) repeat protein
MAAQKDDFQKYMDDGINQAFNQNWKAAIDAFSRAIQLNPQSADAHSNLGLALLNAGQLERALKIYRRANEIAPDDPEPLERIAEVYEGQGQLKEAAQQYVKVADAYLALKDWNKAISNWEHATQLTPGLVGIHAKLAQAYERLGDNKQAIREYLTLAYNFRRMSDVDKAIRAVERALRLDKNHTLALNTLRALKSGGEVVLPAEMLNRGKAKSEPEPELDPFWTPEDDKEPVEEADPLGPMGEAMTLAMELLAAHVVESGLTAFVSHALQGMEFQRQGLHEKAVDAYRQADKAGLRHPALKMNFGGLLVITEQPQEALKHLGEAVVDSKLGAGALHATGLAYYKLSDHKNASRYLIQSLQAVDTSLVTDKSEIAELMTVYESLKVALDGRTTESLSAINERFTGLLSGKEWKQRIGETRRHLDETLRDEGNQGLVDFLVAKGGDELAQSVSFIDRCIRQGLFTLAMDEAHRAVERSPFYLPIHVRMAEIMMKEGRIRQAINKYNTVAKAYLVRGENDRAAAILEDVLEMAPLDLEVRNSLIELLEGEERHEEALNQYIGLANTYQQLGDFERASQTFAAAERLARRINAPGTKLAQIKHYIADINQMRLNTRQAQRIYEEILEIVADDEKALRGLVEIYYTQGNQVEAVKRLDALLTMYAQKGQISKIISMLEELVRTYPSDPALRSRLAQIYKRTNQTKEAIEQLDALGELQLDAGLDKEAANTIRQIIAMGPDRVDDYKKLLAQLKV